MIEKFEISIADKLPTSSDALTTEELINEVIELDKLAVVKAAKRGRKNLYTPNEGPTWRLQLSPRLEMSDSRWLERMFGLTLQLSTGTIVQTQLEGHYSEDGQRVYDRRTAELGYYSYPQLDRTAQSDIVHLTLETPAYDQKGEEIEEAVITTQGGVIVPSNPLDTRIFFTALTQTMRQAIEEAGKPPISMRNQNELNR